MADRVDAGVDDVKPSCIDPSGDRRRAQADAEQLTPCDDAMLPLRQLYEAQLDRFCPHSGHFPTRRGHARTMAPRAS
jgi:hypothetical protein